MSKWNIAILALLCIFLIYVATDQWQDKKAAQKKNIELFGKLEQLEQKAIRDNQVIAKNATTKTELENKSIELQEQINELLKDNQCANEPVPTSISDSLYNRANSIRRSSNSSESAN